MRVDQKEMKKQQLNGKRYKQIVEIVENQIHSNSYFIFFLFLFVCLKKKAFIENLINIYIKQLVLFFHTKNIKTDAESHTKLSLTPNEINREIR